jgi:hypothetical protein
LPNDIKIKGSKPISENLSTVTVGDQTSCLEISDKNGARVTGDLEVTGNIIGIDTRDIVIDDLVCDDITCDDITCDDIACDDITCSDINPSGGALAIGGSINAGSNSVTANGGIIVDNITIDGTEIDLSSGDLTFDVAGDIIFNAAGTNVKFDSGTTSSIDFDCNGTTGAGASVKFMSVLDTNDYFQIDTTTLGATTITTVDDGGAEADLTLNIDGFIDINSAAGENITLDSGANIILDAASGVFKFYDTADIDDYFKIVVAGATGATTFSTISADDDGHLTLDIDGSIILDSNDGNFIAKKAGTEFSATGSAYAGMILGYSMIRNEAGNGNTTDSIITLNQTSFTLIASVQGTKAGVTFIAPPSGNVEIEFCASMYNSMEHIFFGLSTSHSSYTEVEDIHTYDNFGNYYGDETDRFTLTMKWIVEGLTAGTSYTYYIWYKVATGTAYIYHGESDHHATLWHMPPVITKATALPATFSITGD